MEYPRRSLFFAKNSFARPMQPVQVQRVTDADTVWLLDADGKRIKLRMNDIDGPEMAQQHGPESKAMLVGLLERPVALDGLEDDWSLQLLVTGSDKYRRTLGKLFWVSQAMLAAGKSGLMNINLEMVRRGGAWHYAKYSPENRVAAQAQEEARQNLLGLWGLAVHPEAPWDYRKRVKRSRKP